MTAIVNPPLWMQNVNYPAQRDRSLYDLLVETEGVFNGFASALPGGLTFRVTAGMAAVKGDEVSNQGKYFVDSDAAVDVVLAAVGVARTDYICLLINDPAVAGGRAG